MLFANREDAGRRLAEALFRFKDQQPVVLALPRGGVPIGFAIATRLGAPLDVVLVRKLGHPLSPELAIGAIAEIDGIERVIDEAMAKEWEIPQSYLEQEIARQTRANAERRLLYFKDRTPAEVKGRTAIVVDDGIATGATMRAALRAVRRRQPAKLVLAVPVAPASTIETMRTEADDVVCLATPEDFGAVGFFYVDFRAVEDQEVVDLLKRAAAPVSAPAPTPAPAAPPGEQSPSAAPRERMPPRSGGE
jgi:putative phosphoribosyl transferase